MKRCPQCGREYDVTMSYCLDDGSELLYGPASPSSDEPQTAILRDSPARGESESNATLLYPSVAAGDSDPGAEKTQTTTNKLLAMLGIAVVILGIAFLAYSFLTTSTKQINSIAVMPFVNESGDANVDYLSDGMTETLIRSLSQIPGLNVKSRSSVFRYKGKETDAKTLGNDLGVQAVLNGHVVQRGDQLSVSLELINADNENVIWTDTYDRKAGDLVSLQNDIARDVSNNLRIKLTNSDQQKLAKNYTSDPEAYRLYLQGRYYWNKRTFSEVAKGVPYFQQAVARDPNFALGYVGLADSDEDRDRPLKKEYIQRALQIDDQLAEAHASLGYQYMLDYNWTASEKELRRAMELDPKYPRSYAWNGARLMMIGRYDESLAEIQRGLDLDPMSNGINFYKGVCLGVAGRRDEAIQQFKKIIEMDPAFPWAHSHLSRIYRLNGDLAAAAEERATSLELDGKPDLAKGTRDAFAKGGWDALQAYAREHNTVELFSIMLTADEKERWIKHLTDQADQGIFWLFLIKTDPIFDPLRGDPRFDALVHKFDPPQ
jgi:TolB-like protein/Tfp pilus assembly protein PilF